MTDIPGNSSTDATIAVGGTVTGSLETVGDHDWFAITLTAGQSISIALSGAGADPVYDTVVVIRDAAGNVLDSDDDGGAGLYSVLNFTARTTGTYYIDAASYFYDDPNTDIGDYQLTVSTYVAPPPLPLFSYDQIADQLVNGFWENQGGSARHFDVAEGDTITVNLTALTADGQYLARQALAIWSDSLGIAFAESDGAAQIVFDDSDSGAYSTSTTSGAIITSSFVNVDVAWLTDYGATLDSYSFQTYLHEIGHALGLGHAGNYNGAADYPTDALYRNDAWSTTVMSYFSQQQNSYFADQGFTYDYAVTPMVGDLVAMAILYGTPTTTRTGDTVYGFGGNAGRDVFDAALNPNVAYTIIDSGGVDTLDYSGFAANQRIDLNAEAFSNVGANVGNVAIARGTVIENAIGGSGDDVLVGNAANNVLTGNGGDDSLQGGEGSDTAAYENAPSGVTVGLAIATAQATGGAGTDTLTSIENLTGSGYGDTLSGTDSANLLEGGDGDDVLNGGGGNDTASYLHAASKVVIDLNIAGPQSTRSQGVDTLNSIESVSGSQFNDVITGDTGANQLIGNGGNDVLYGRDGNDSLIGGDGHDRFYGGAGNDTLSGGAGTDTAIYDDASGAITVDLSLTTAQDTGAAGIDRLSGIERLTGSRNADMFTGDSANNVIYGHRGNDLIHGGGGDDRVMGDQDSDSLFGDSGNDRLYGRTGDDQLHGGDGNDRLYGEDGDDLFDGGAGVDIAYYTTATAGVTVDLGVTGPQDTVSNGFDTLVGIERIIASGYDDRLTGSGAGETFNGQGGNDQVDGGGGRDYIFGEAGNDTIGGGGGNDRLYGGAGQDNFRFDTLPSASSNWDYISDYSVVDDTVQLSQSVFAAIDFTGVLSASEFRYGSAASDASDHIIYDQARGYIYYDADGNGGGEQVLFARVAAGTALTSADFVVLAPAQAEPFASAQTDQSGMVASDFTNAAQLSNAVAFDSLHIALFTDAASIDHLIV